MRDIERERERYFVKYVAYDSSMGQDITGQHGISSRGLTLASLEVYIFKYVGTSYYEIIE